jgi:hypothetical protein
MFNVGDAVKVETPGTYVVGRVIKQDGGLVDILTPQGSWLRSGVVWVGALEKTERKLLRKYERIQTHGGRAPYKAYFGPDRLAAFAAEG